MTTAIDLSAYDTPADCRGCRTLAAYLRGGEERRAQCSDCGAHLTAAPPPRPAPYPRNARLALLADCAAIALWDAVARPPSAHPVKDRLRARPPGSDRPEWVDEHHERIARAGRLRARLDALHRADPRAGAVVEWLVQRARALRATAAGEKGALVGRDVARLVARAFADPATRARWHPAPPAPPVLPEAPPAEPAPLEPLPPPHPPRLFADAGPWERALYARDVASYPARLRAHERAEAQRQAAHAAAHAARVARHAAVLAAHPEAQRRYDAAVRAHPAALARGKVGEERHGGELLRRAEQAWFGPAPSTREDDAQGSDA
jgi:LSD1 subclass zinc finger protein